MSYLPKNHYWRVDGKPGFWSSAECAYVTDLPGGWFASVADARAANAPLDRVATPIASEIELRHVLVREGCAGRAPAGPFSAADLMAVFVRIDRAQAAALFSETEIADASGLAVDDARFAELAEAVGMEL